MCDARIVPSIVTHKQVDRISFSSYTDEELKRLSVQKIYNPITFDSLSHPVPGGAHDYALGPVEANDICITCRLQTSFCPGHFGHIQLPLLIYNPSLFQFLYKLVKITCFVCHHFLFKSSIESLLLQGKIKLAEAGLIPKALDLEDVVYSDDKPHDDIDNIQQAIDQFIQLSLSENINNSNNSNNSNNNSINTRHITEFKHSLVKHGLFKSTNMAAICIHCGAPSRRVRQDYNVKISFMPLPHNKAHKYMKAWNDYSAEDSDNDNTDTEESRELEEQGSITKDWCLKTVLLTPNQIRRHLKLLWKNEYHLINSIFRDSVNNTDTEFSQVSHDIFFMTLVPILPTKFRPISKLNGQSYENPQTSNIRSILSKCAEVQKSLNALRENSQQEVKNPAKYSDLQRSWFNLQSSVNTFMDATDVNNKSNSSFTSSNSGFHFMGIRQMLEHKQGLFRQNLMGKRVDYAARSVISPDLNIDVDEIGIPMVFATKLTFPQPVTHWNVRQLWRAIINGPEKHPGATHIEDADGTKVLLNAKNRHQRESLARQLLTPGRSQGSKKVHRHLQNGDILLVNRQPTLHRPSIMAHKARVLKGEKTLRLHYATCKAYNADFDGDEMNVHLPQNEIARSEAFNIVSTYHQYLTPKDGTPLSGLIQDHVIGGVVLTIRGRMLNSETYQQLLYSALPNHDYQLKLLPPCILKPEKQWSGKQLISTVLLNLIPRKQQPISLTSRAKTGGRVWSSDAEFMKETYVLISRGELLCGVLDKSQFGSTQFGLIHACHQLYGGKVATSLLSAFARLFSVTLQMFGFSFGIEDLLLTKTANIMRNTILKTSHEKELSACREAFFVDQLVSKNLEDDFSGIFHAEFKKRHLDSLSTNNNAIKRVDMFYRKYSNMLNNELNSSLSNAHLKPFPSNSFQLMVESGAKGSAVNSLQISSLLGQIELEGARPSLMISGRSLPSFFPYDTSLRAGGFVSGRFLTGICPQEYFFHCMAGREGLVDTAVKTSRSGYLQRCLVKHLEGLKISYDLTVRDSDESVVQFLYGEDGLSVENTAYLRSEQFKFAIDNFDAFRQKYNPDDVIDYLHCEEARSYIEKASLTMNKQAKRLHCTMDEYIYNKNIKTSPFLTFFNRHHSDFSPTNSEDTNQIKFNYRKKSHIAAIRAWYELTAEQMLKYDKYIRALPDPVQSKLRPDLYIGSISVKMQDIIDSYLSTNFDSFTQNISIEDFRTSMELKYLTTLCQPGEPVGLLAAQSIGEPSTQMTLNTFHFAGRGEMNVTLGIPRLREIIMTASSKISTPCMEIPLLDMPNSKKAIKVAKEIVSSLKRVTMDDVVNKLEVWDSFESEKRERIASTQFRMVKIRIEFLSSKVLKTSYGITLGQVLDYVETQYIKIFLASLEKMVRRNTDAISRVRLDRLMNDEDENNSSDDDDTKIKNSKRRKNGMNNHAEKSSKEIKNSANKFDVPENDTGRGESDSDSDAIEPSNQKRYASYNKNENSSDSEIVDSDKESENDDCPETNANVNIYMTDDEYDDGVRNSQISHDAKSPLVIDMGDHLCSDRIRKVLNQYSFIRQYTFDQENGEWCEMRFELPLNTSSIMILPVLENLNSKCIVRQSPGITRSFIKEEKGRYSITTEGANLLAIWKYSNKLDLNRVYTNDIALIAATYGIEAACRAISKEIENVFAMYGICVDPRHLYLLADYQTMDGKFRGCNRNSIECNPSPIQQMSFEAPLKFLQDCVLTRKYDSLKSPSASIAAGQIVNTGTGCFELIQRIS